MSEIITTYLLSDPKQAIPMDRDDFYIEQINEFKINGKPTKAVEIVQIILFTPDHEIILQKRSPEKNHNPGLIDKTNGGHVTFGDKPNYTVTAETLQELQVPSIVLDTGNDFKKTYKLLKNYLTNSALIQFIDSQIININKVFRTGEKIAIANKYGFYLGVYGGAMRPADKEASGIMFYKYKNLLEDINQAPQMFTNDLKFFLKKYETEIQNFVSTLE